MDGWVGGWMAEPWPRPNFPPPPPGSLSNSLPKAPTMAPGRHWQEDNAIPVQASWQFQPSNPATKVPH